MGRPGGKEIDDAAAHRVFAGVAHRAGAQEAVGLEPVDELRRVDHVAGRGREGLGRDAGLRGGTRCTRAFTVVERMRGLSSEVLERASRASVVMRCAVMAALGETRS